MLKKIYPRFSKGFFNDKMYISDLGISSFLTPMARHNNLRQYQNVASYHLVITTGKDGQRLLPIYENIFFRKKYFCT